MARSIDFATWAAANRAAHRAEGSRAWSLRRAFIAWVAASSTLWGAILGGGLLAIL
ncbi:MAG: hypothetical protein HY246_11700 [Proteobacteria bacterium]|nr:hypothetical protein [Pseudomonadota bacterium]